MAERNGLATVSALSPAITDNEWNEARQKFIIENFCGGAPLPVAMAFIESAMRRNLSPEAKQLYLIKRRNKDKETGQWVDQWTQQTGIDGFRIIAERSGKYAGCDEPVFFWKNESTLERATVTVYKMVQNQRCAFTATAYWEEYNPNQGQWGRMPRTMLAKCAEALALRKAFPEDLSGLYTDAEMDQASMVDVQSSVAETRPAPSASARQVDRKTGEIRSLPQQAPSASGDYTWSHFWPWAKTHHIKNEEDYVALTGRGTKGMAPSAARELMEAKIEEMARDIIDEENGVIDIQAPGDMFPDVPFGQSAEPDRYTSR